MTSTSNNVPGTDSAKLTITVGSNTFNATVYDNATATAFKARLPLTINMTELNGNEKYFDLPDNLPANAPNSAPIQVCNRYTFYRRLKKVLCNGYNL